MKAQADTEISDLCLHIFAKIAYIVEMNSTYRITNLNFETKYMSLKKTI